MRNRSLGYVFGALVLAASVGCSGEHGDGHDHEHEPTTPTGLPTSAPIEAITYDALFVVNGGDGSVSVINTEVNEVAATIKLTNAAYPHHISLSDDRARMLLAAPGADLSGGHGAHEGHGVKGAVLLLDASTGATLKSRFTDAMNHNALFSSGGDEVWTSQMTTPGAVLVLDAATLDTKQQVAVGDGPAEVTFAKGGAQAFVANGASNSVSVIDAKEKVVVKTIPVGKNPVGAWQGSNGVAYVDNETDKTITAIDTTSLEVVGTFMLGFTPGMVALAPGGEIWVTDSDAGRVALFDATAGSFIAEIPAGEGAHAIAFSGDGKAGYVTNQVGGTVTVIDVMARTVTKTIPVGAKPNGLAWRAK